MEILWFFIKFLVCSSSERPKSRLGKTIKTRTIEWEIGNSWHVFHSQCSSQEQHNQKLCTSQ